jgi:hypothetical protein
MKKTIILFTSLAILFTFYYGCSDKNKYKHPMVRSGAID